MSYDPQNQNYNPQDPNYNQQNQNYNQQDPNYNQQNPNYDPQNMNNNPQGSIPDSEAKTLAMWMHLSTFAGALVGFPLLGPLIFWLIVKDKHPFLDDQGKEALNFGISMMIYSLVTIALCFVLIGFALLPVLAIIGIVFPIIAAVKSNGGEWYRYPLTIRLIN